jgi:DegV family protein with EDD domain
MRIGIVVDSACDLPPNFIKDNRIIVLPTTVRIGDAVLADHRDSQTTLEFLRTGVAERSHEAETTPFTAAQVHHLFLQRLIVDYDVVFCLTISKLRSNIHDNITQASIAVLNDYRPLRQAAGIDSVFEIHVIDTLNLFAGQAVNAVEAVRLRNAGSAAAQIRTRLQELADNTYGYMVPRDLYYLRARARVRANSDRSIGLVGAALGSTLDIKPLLRAYHGETAAVARMKGFDSAVQQLFEFTARKVYEGLITPTVCIGYGGELSELRKLPGYRTLHMACAETGTNVYESMMSLTGMVNVGRGALGIGFASAPHRFY